MMTRPVFPKTSRFVQDAFRIKPMQSPATRNVNKSSTLVGRKNLPTSGPIEKEVARQRRPRRSASGSRRRNEESSRLRRRIHQRWQRNRRPVLGREWNRRSLTIGSGDFGFGGRASPVQAVRFGWRSLSESLRSKRGPGSGQNFRFFGP